MACRWTVSSCKASPPTSDCISPYNLVSIVAIRMSLTRRVFLHRIAQLGGYSAAFAGMQALGLLPAVGQSTLPQLPSGFGKGKKVVILGGGIAGMVSAYELRKAGFDCTILEARNRPGGRSWTIREGTKVEFTDGTTQTCRSEEHTSELQSRFD